MRVAVYTAISGGRDKLQLKEFEGVDFFAWTDADLAFDRRMTWHKIEEKYKDPNRNAKIYKVLPQYFMPDYDWWIWIDGNIEIMASPLDLIAKYGEFSVHKHCLRDCVYKEARECIELGVDNRETIETQMNRYRALGYPEHAGLYECGILVRQNTQTVRDINSKWWAEISTGSKRDQLSFPIALGDFKPTIMQGTVYNDPDFRYRPHL